jgi:hypothetical protein
LRSSGRWGSTCLPLPFSRGSGPTPTSTSGRRSSSLRIARSRLFWSN